MIKRIVLLSVLFALHSMAMDSSSGNQSPHVNCDLDVNCDLGSGVFLQFEEENFLRDYLVPLSRDFCRLDEKVAYRALALSIVAGLSVTAMSYYKKLPQKICDAHIPVPKMILKPIAWLTPLALGVGTSLISFYPLSRITENNWPGIQEDRIGWRVDAYKAPCRGGEVLSKDRAARIASALRANRTCGGVSSDIIYQLFGRNLSNKEINKHFGIITAMLDIIAGI